MGLAGVDHAFELSVGQQALGNDGRRQMRPIAGFGGATEAMAADCTSRVGCEADPGIRID